MGQKNEERGAEKRHGDGADAAESIGEKANMRAMKEPLAAPAFFRG